MKYWNTIHWNSFSLKSSDSVLPHREEVELWPDSVLGSHFPQVPYCNTSFIHTILMYSLTFIQWVYKILNINKTSCHITRLICFTRETRKLYQTVSFVQRFKEVKWSNISSQVNFIVSTDICTGHPDNLIQYLIKKQHFSPKSKFVLFFSLPMNHLTRPQMCLVTLRGGLTPWVKRFCDASVLTP